jgi:hypothetical protein
MQKLVRRSLYWASGNFLIEVPSRGYLNYGKYRLAHTEANRCLVPPPTLYPVLGNSRCWAFECEKDDGSNIEALVFIVFLHHSGCQDVGAE